MSKRVPEGRTVFDAALERLIEIYEGGHRIVVSFSAGKDSGICLEMAILAAKLTGRLPVDVVMRDEEIMFPGTYEYAERVAARPEVRFRWLIANQPIINVFNREQPYWWVFDPSLPPERWMRQPPSMAEVIPEKNIDAMTIPERFPVEEGKTLFAVVGLRVSESIQRMYGLFSSKGHVTKPNKHGVRLLRPIYDWQDADVWKAIENNGWDYNKAYDVMFRMLGGKGKLLRIAPPTMNIHGAPLLSMAQRAWPRWFDKLAERCPGVRTVAQFGTRVLKPDRRHGETWQVTFERECVEKAPEWIRERAVLSRDVMLRAHSRHSTAPFPENSACPQCVGNMGSWKSLTIHLYNGDPFSTKMTRLPLIEPHFLREGAGTWGGKPTW